MVCFKNITAALLWCFTVQLQLLEADWPAGILDTEEGREIEKDGIVIYKGLSVRMGIHWGSPVFERNPITQRMDYFGPVVNKASRICNAADGGQICVSSDVIAALRNFPSMFDEDAELQTNSSAEVDAFSGTFPVSRDLLQLKQLGFHVVELGERRLKGLETPETLSLVYSKQLLARIEIDKSEMMATGSSPIVTPSNIVSPKAISSIEASPALNTAGTTDSSNNMTSNSSVSTTPMDYLTARPIKQTNTRKVVRTIDPNLVCAMSNLAIRLERLTSGNVLSQHMAGSSINREYTLNNEGNEDTTHTVSTAPSGLGLMLDRHIREDATDEELVIMMENCVARVEVSVSRHIQRIVSNTVYRTLCLPCIYRKWVILLVFWKSWVRRLIWIPCTLLRLYKCTLNLLLWLLKASLSNCNFFYPYRRYLVFTCHSLNKVQLIHFNFVRRQLNLKRDIW